VRPLVALAGLATFFVLATGAFAQGWPRLRVSPNACVAGTPSRGWCGDGGQATAARLASPSDVVPTPDGGFIIADTLNDALRYVSPGGEISTVAYRGFRGGPSAFCSPGGITLVAGQSLFADWPCSRVVALSSTGDVHTVAGTGAIGFSGDGGLATAAKLSGPSDVEWTPDGSFVIGDSGNARIRRVTPSGIITTVARLAVSGVAVTADGSFIVSSDDEHVIQRVDPSGGISTIAGTPGEMGFSGDGGPARQARLSSPAGVAATPDGGFLFADWGNSRIRRVSPTGVINTVAGRGRFDTVAGTGFSGDGGQAEAAHLSGPCGVASTPDGGMLIADSGNDRIRMVSPQGVIRTVAGSGQPHDAPFCWFLGECGGGCGNPEISRLWNYFYITGRPLRARRHRAVRVRFVTTRPARVLAKVLRRRTLVAAARRSFHAGERVITVRRGLRPGQYKVDLRGRSGRAVQKDSARLRVR
jgi:hypothetical protein